MMEYGIYRHYKNKLYLVIGVGKHSETLEDLVVYQSMYEDPQFGKGALWVRPVSNFLDMVELDGKLVPRFVKLM